MSMLKRFLRAVSNVLWAIGAEDMAMNVLLKTYEKEPYRRKTLQTEVGLPENGFKVEICFEDHQAISELDPWVCNTICLPTSIEEVN